MPYFTDCTAPFAVGIVTDTGTDTPPADATMPPDMTTANILQSRGKIEILVPLQRLR